mgnify:CR=1 FL=1
MKRSPIARKTPLAGGGELRRTEFVRKAGSELVRSGPLPARRATPRRTSRVHVCCGEIEGKARVRERSGGTRKVYGLCEVCLLRQATQFSHRKARGRGGCWCPSNGLAVCGSGGNLDGCHGRVHADLGGEATAAGWAVATGHDPGAVSVVLAVWAPRRVLLLPDGGVELLAA